MSVWNYITEQISQTTGQQFSPDSPTPIGGGCINQAFRLSGLGQTYFVKINQATRLSMFEAEAAGLREIAGSNSIRVPKPVCHGRHQDNSFLVLEHIQMQAGGDMQQAGSWR